MQYPLQTRAAVLTRDRMATPERMARALEELAGRGYNTVVVPIVTEGDCLFRTNSEGSLAQRACPGREVFTILQDYDFTVWLMVDIMGAGPPSSGRLGTIASSNRHWLMRNIQGDFTPPGRPDMPGLFCWTSVGFRRFLGNLLADVFDAFPADGLVVDARLLPRTTTDPATWTHLGFSCLQRIQRELALNVEEFLVNPTAETHQRIVDWRYDQLRVLLEYVKARVLKMRRQVPLMLATTFENPADRWAPWGPWVAAGIAEGVVLHTPSESIAEHVAALDAAVGDPRPFLVAIDAETDLADLARGMVRIPANGFCVMHPGPLQRVVMPNPEFTWDMTGALEEHPITAATEIAKSVADQFIDCLLMRPFFQKLAEYLNKAGERISYEVATNIRGDLLETMSRIRRGDVAVQGDRDAALHKLDMLARLLLLAQVPAVEN